MALPSAALVRAARRLQGAGTVARATTFAKPSAALQIRPGSSSTDHHHGEHHYDGPTMHPDHWLKVAREWPKEYYAPLHADYESHLKWPAADHLSGSETLENKATFFNATWGRVVLIGLFGYGLYKVNEYVTADQSEHPITRLLGSLIKSTDEIDKEVEAVVKFRRTEANDQLILTERPKSATNFHRLVFPDRFYRASDHLIEPGTQVDLSDLEIKYGWQKDDEYFGPPYPKNK
ncbi:hypothetical protein HDU96_005819 [Phlyctochytrium bullatum]|nr:hypothetical protein HDU96_005819 [Phlyctochytrium bullatum]